MAKFSNYARRKQFTRGTKGRMGRRDTVSVSPSVNNLFAAGGVCILHLSAASCAASWPCPIVPGPQGLARRLHQSAPPTLTVDPDPDPALAHAGTLTPYCP